MTYRFNKFKTYREFKFRRQFKVKRKLVYSSYKPYYRPRGRKYEPRKGYGSKDSRWAMRLPMVISHLWIGGNVRRGEGVTVNGYYLDKDKHIISTHRTRMNYIGGRYRVMILFYEDFLFHQIMSRPMIHDAEPEWAPDWIKPRKPFPKFGEFFDS